MPRVLITNNQLHSYGGSEMVTLELAEEFLRRGWEVDVYTNFLDYPFRSEFDQLEPNSLLRFSDAEADFTECIYDLIWVNHSVLPPALITKLSMTDVLPPIIWHHMSSFVDLEAPILGEVEMTVTSRVSAVSEEAAANLSRFGIPRDQITLLHNPVPQQFLGTPAKTFPECPRTILSISNHVPSELEDAFALLESQGIQVKRIGTLHPRRVTPEAFDHADAIVTIGKSTQYALSLGTPCFEYDVFGGCGWITGENFEDELATNFSGRTSRRKLSPESIVREFLTGYSAARAYSASSVEEHRIQFSLPRHLNAILQAIGFTTTPRRLPSELAARWSTYAKLQRQYYRSVTSAHLERPGLLQAKVRAAELETELQKEQAVNLALRNSRSYRLGNALLRPLRALFPNRT